MRITSRISLIFFCVTLVAHPAHAGAPLHIVGHRGLRWDAPENTLASMLACLALGVSIELDVRRSKEGVLIVLHDATLDRTTEGKGKAADFTLAELKKLDAGAKFDARFKDERIPTLEEVFALRAQAPAKAGIIAVDLKEADTEEDIVRLAQKHKIVNHLVFIGLAIGDADVRQRLRKAAPAAHVARLVPAGEALDTAIKDEHADWIYVRHLPTREEMGRVHAAGKHLFLSGPKAAALDPDFWKQAAELGFDAILTDHPLALARTLRGDAETAAAPMTRIASGVSGHIHPAACLTKSGAILTIFSQSDMKDQRVSRSSDRGKTWSEPTPFPHTARLSIYPGSLTTLRDGRIIHAWNTWYMNEQKKKSRFVQFSISDDEGKTWGEPKSLPKNPEAESIIRHPIVELGPKEWLFPLSDQTVIYDAGTEKVTPLGDGHKHGLVPMVRTPKGTFVSGAGLRSEDGGKSWQKVAPFPAVGANGWRFEMFGLDNGWLIAGEVEGPGVGGNRWRFVVSRDDGKTWDFDKNVELYNPGRAIGGRACPRTVQLDKDTLGTVLYDVDAKQPGGPGVFFIVTPLAKFK
jgi:glycerophosphoryl diester phosphodiesterase